MPIAAVLAVGVGAGSAAALAWTNPTPEEYRAHAAEQLVAFASKELCNEEVLPMVLRLWIRDCPGLIASQQSTLADLAGRFTSRWNFLVGSVYTTKIGGQELLPGFAIPHAEVVTLAVAGRFVLLRTETSAGGSQ